MATQAARMAPLPKSNPPEKAENEQSAFAEEAATSAAATPAIKPVRVFMICLPAPDTTARWNIGRTGIKVIHGRPAPAMDWF